MPEFDLLAVACGGGRNTAQLIGMYEKGIKPDLITFANTGRLDHSEGEKPETYRFLEAFSKWCDSHFGVPITEVHKNSMYGSLYDNCVRKQMLPSAAYGLRSCSDKWKIQPQDLFMNHYYSPAIAVWSTCTCGAAKGQHRKRILQAENGSFIRENGKLVTHWLCPESNEEFIGRKVTKAIGYDAGEERRAKVASDEKYNYWYPLIEWGWFLDDCIAAFKRHGLPVPVKSACYYCPSSTKEQVVQLHEQHPELYWSAVRMEDIAIASGELQSVKGLGRHWTWRELIQITPQQREGLIEAPQMACACFDAEDDD